MADEKFSQLTGVSAQATDILPISRPPFGSGSNYSVTAGSIAALAPAPSFAGLTGGTSTAALVVGSGGSLIASGGTIVATSVSFNGVTAGTNTAALVVGSGGSLMVGGTGIVQATQLQAVVISGTAPITGQILTATSSTTAAWQTPSGGSPFSTVGQGGFWGGGLPQNIIYATSSLSQNTIEIVGAGDLLLWQFALEAEWTISNLSVWLQAQGSTGSQSFFGLYSAAMNLVITSGAIAVDGVPGPITVSFTPVILPADVYYFFAADGSPQPSGPHPYFYGFAGTSGINEDMISLINLFSTKVGIGANVVTKASGAPPTTGAISLGNVLGMPGCFFGV